MKITMFSDFASYRRALKDGKFGDYPCADLLNNALRHLLKVDNNHEVDYAISEIIHCLSKANGYYHDDIVQMLCAKDEKWKNYFLDHQELVR